MYVCFLTYVRDMEEFGGLEINEKTIAILRDRGYAQMVKQDGDRINQDVLCTNSVREKRKECLNVERDAIGRTNGVVHLERDAWSTVERLKKTINEYAPSRVWVSPVLWGCRQSATTVYSM